MLRGVRVVELAGLAPVPMAGVIFADLGCDVIRVDRFRRDIPDVLGWQGHKRSVAMDLAHPAAPTVLHSLLSRADVLLDPFRPGRLEALGLGPTMLTQRHPRLIVARVSGYGQGGGGAEHMDAAPAPPPPAMTHAAGHDINYLSMSGLLSRMARPGQPPQPPMNLLADFGGGSAMTVVGVLAALLQQRASGRGCVLDCSITHNTGYLATLVYLIHQQAWWGGAATFLLPGHAPFYDTYATACGRFMAVGAIEPPFFAALVAGLGLHEAIPLHHQTAQAQWPAMREAIRARFAAHDQAHWCRVFRPGGPHDACVTPVLTLAEGMAAMAATPPTQHGLSVAWPTPSGTRPPPPAPSQGGEEWHRPIPTPLVMGHATVAAAVASTAGAPVRMLEAGADTREVLTQVCGLSPAEVAMLEDVGCVKQAQSAPLR